MQQLNWIHGIWDIRRGGEMIGFINFFGIYFHLKEGWRKDYLLELFRLRYFTG